MISGPSIAVAPQSQRASGGGAGGASPTFFLLDVVNQQVRRFDPATMTGSIIYSTGANMSYGIGFDDVTQKVVLLGKPTATIPGFFTIDPDGSNPASLGWDDDHDSQINQELGQMLVVNDVGPYLLWCNDSHELRRADWPGGGNQNTRSTIVSYRDLDYYAAIARVITGTFTTGIRSVQIEGAGATTIVDPGRIYRVRVDPDAGYIFWIDSDTTPDRVGRCDLDGGNIIKLFDALHLNLLEINRVTQRIYALGNTAPNHLYEYDYSGNQTNTSTFDVGTSRSICRGHLS